MWERRFSSLLVYPHVGVSSMTAYTLEMEISMPALPLHEYTLMGLVLFLSCIVLWQQYRLSLFLRGKNGQNLEQTISAILGTREQELVHRNKTTAHLDVLSKKLAKTGLGVGTVRYSALSGDTSGRQSFATAFVSEEGDGVVISSIHSRDLTRVYAKPVEDFVSSFELSDEEKKAIEKAGKVVGE